MSDAELRPPRRHRLAGWLLLIAAAGAVLSAFADPTFALLAGAAGWLGAALVVRDIAQRSRRQSAVLIIVGLAGMAWGTAQGVTPEWQRALAGNAGLIGLLIGVGFLQLVAIPRGAAHQALPRGRGAFLNTQIGVHLFGSVINLSTVFIVADRLRATTALTREHVMLLTRSFSAAAFWSPFFAAMAAALVYAPEARLPHLLAFGIPLAAGAIAGTWLTLGRRVEADFPGYPVRYDSLVLPGALAAAVLLIHLWKPELSVVAIITLLAPLVTAAILVPRGRSGRRALRQQVHENLPGMGNELTLFLAAGVLAAGLATTIGALGGWTPFATFGPLQAWLVLIAVVGLALIGVHPVIGIAAAGTLLEPLQPNHSLLAATFLAAWGIGVPASPMSALNLALQGRYGLDGFRTARLNFGYMVAMLLLAGVALQVMGRLLGL